jgi:hypothetical protein
VPTVLLAAGFADALAIVAAGSRDAGLGAVLATAFPAGFFAAFLATGPAVAFLTEAFFVAACKGTFFATTFFAVPRRGAFFAVVFPGAAFFAALAGAAFREGDVFAAADFPAVVFLAGALRVAVFFTARRAAAGLAAAARFALFFRAGACFRAAAPVFVAFLVAFFTVGLVLPMVAILPPCPLGGWGARQQ